MIKLIITDAGVSRSYKDNPTLRFSEGEGTASVRFRIGKKVFDSRCEGNHRWINLNVKAFGDVCERIRKMKLKEGSYVNIIGRYDEETWGDKDTGEQRTAPVLIVDEIEYCYSGNGQKEEKSDGAPEPRSRSDGRQRNSAKAAEERPEPEEARPICRRTSPASRALAGAPIPSSESAWTQKTK